MKAVDETEIKQAIAQFVLPLGDRRRLVEVIGGIADRAFAAGLASSEARRSDTLNTYGMDL